MKRTAKGFLTTLQRFVSNLYLDIRRHDKLPVTLPYRRFQFFPSDVTSSTNLTCNLRISVYQLTHVNLQIFPFAQPVEIREYARFIRVLQRFVPIYLYVEHQRATTDRVDIIPRENEFRSSLILPR